MAPMNTRNIKRSLIGAAAGVALLAGPALAPTGSVPSAHAAPGRSIISQPCLACTSPTISVDKLDYLAGSIDISGANFNPGDPVHIEVIAGDGWNMGSLMAEADATATLALTLPLGNGQFVHIPGGRIAVALTPSPNSPILCQGVLFASAQAVDEATGARAVGYSFDASEWWDQIAPEYAPGGCS